MTDAKHTRRSGDRALPGGVVTASEWSWRLLAIVALAAVIVYLIGVFHEIVVPLLVALLVAALLVPLVNRLHGLGWPRWVAILVSLLAFAAIVVGLVYLVVWQVRAGLPALEHQSAAAYDRARSALRQPPWNVSDSQFGGYLKDAGTYLQKDGGKLLGGVLSFGLTAGHILAGALIAIFATIFILIDGHGIWSWVVRVFPRSARPGLTRAGHAGWHTLTSFVRVQILVALVNGIGIGLVAFFLGLPLAIPIAVLVLLASFIPVIGAIVSGIIAVVIALIFGGPIQALIMLAGVLLVHLLEAHVMQPLLVGGAVKVHPLAVVVAVAAGSGLAGVPGALFAVPAVAVGNAMVTAMLRHSSDDGLVEKTDESSLDGTPPEGAPADGAPPAGDASAKAAGVSATRQSIPAGGGARRRAR